MSLLTSTVKPVMSKDKKNCFDLINVSQTFNFQSETNQDMMEWIEKIQQGVANILNTVTSVKEQTAVLKY